MVEKQCKKAKLDFVVNILYGIYRFLAAPMWRRKVLPMKWVLRLLVALLAVGSTVAEILPEPQNIVAAKVQGVILLDDGGRHMLVHRNCVAKARFSSDVNFQGYEIVCAPSPEKRKKAPLLSKADNLREHWRNFGVSGRLYRDEVPAGIIGIEGSLVAFTSGQGFVWFVDFEPNGDRSVLDTRKIYIVRVSEVASRGCGSAMKNFHTPPPQCIVEEEEIVLDWQQTKSFFDRILGVYAGSGNYAETMKWWKEMEEFLR